MALFGKLFEKKHCDLCGGDIGLLSNRKLEDGHCCKECAAKLSPWLIFAAVCCIWMVFFPERYTRQGTAVKTCSLLLEISAFDSSGTTRHTSTVSVYHASKFISHTP